MVWAISRSSLLAIYGRKFTTNAVVASKQPISRPGPPPLPRKDQKEFEELVKTAARPAAASTPGPSEDSGEQLHPDVRRAPPPEFIGDVNPITGEQGGPKREPVKHGDWSYSGRVTDF